MFKNKTIDSLFNRKERNDEETQTMSSVQNATSNFESNVEQEHTMPIMEHSVQPPPSKSMRIEQEKNQY
ncbi:hypothetical protein L6164_024029 [Bauhinia variegata]|uniref:Uncharacterized protein n=1 Tax=Bauhinia variegata TaxID=167791 RepID=A0ACB9LXT7_BAUVA|nr:hypothetical protein L6164_024029 [Bauhinia variegata]